MERTAELARANSSLRLEIAERRSAVEALRKSQERYRVVSELGSDLAFGFRIDQDEHMREGWVTDAYSRITGYTLDELAGTGWLRLIHPDDEQGLRRRFAEILAGQTRELELRLVSKSGRVATVHARLDVAREASGQTFRVVGAARDVTDARRAEAERRDLERQVLEARRLESLRADGGVAHDFTTCWRDPRQQRRPHRAPPDSPLHLRRVAPAARARRGRTERCYYPAGQESRSSRSTSPIWSRRWSTCCAHRSRSRRGWSSTWLRARRWRATPPRSGRWC